MERGNVFRPKTEETNNRKLSITPDKNSVVQKHEGKF